MGHLEHEQVEWVNELTHRAEAQEKFEKQEQLKSAAIAKLFNQRERSRSEILQGTDLTMQQEGTGKTLKTRTVDPMLGFDHDDQRDDYRLQDDDGEIEGPDEPDFNQKFASEKEKLEYEASLQQKNFQKNLRAGRIVDSMARQMEQMTVDELDEHGKVVMETVDVDDLDSNGKPIIDQGKVKKKQVTRPKQVPLFSKEEITEELYEPLKRRGLVPDTFIPDKYSSTQEMLTGSFDAYKKRLKKEDQKSWFAENKDLGITTFRAMFSFAGEGLTIKSDLDSLATDPTSLQLDKSTFDSNIKNISEIKENLTGSEGIIDQVQQSWEFMQNGLDIAVDGVYEGYKDVSESRAEKNKPKEEVEPKTEKEKAEAKYKTRRQAAPKLATAFIAPLATSLGGAIGSVAVSSALGAMIKPGDLAKLLGEEIKPPEKELKKKVIEEVTEKITHGMRAALEKMTKDFKDDTKGSKAKIAGLIDKAISDFEAAINPDELAKSLSENKFGDLATAFTTASKAAGKVFSDALKDQDLKALFEDNASKVQAAANEEVEKEFNRKDKDPVPQETVHEHEEAQKKLPTEKQHQPDWVLYNNMWVCTACQSNSNDAEKFAGIVEAKIAALKSSQSTIKWLSTVGGMAFDAASNFLGPLAIGGSLIRIAKNGKAAYDRYKDFDAFCTRQAGMFRAASAYSAPVAQFMYNSEVQGLNYTLTAAGEGLKIIAAILQCTPVAPVGAGMAIGVGIAQSIQSVLYEINKRMDLETAWSTYKSALERPENRKLGLIALSKNPTLAKYSVAWGSYEKKDPLVADFVSYCGLDADSLQDPEASLDKIVEYLEARLPDDQIIVGGEKRRGIPTN